MTIAPNWQQAEQVAKEISSAWHADAPGGVILAFDAEGDKLSVAAGLENLSTGKAFSDQSVGRFASITKHLFVRSFCSILIWCPLMIVLGRICLSFVNRWRLLRSVRR